MKQNLSPIPAPLHFIPLYSISFRSVIFHQSKQSLCIQPKSDSFFWENNNNDSNLSRSQGSTVTPLDSGNFFLLLGPFFPYKSVDLFLIQVSSIFALILLDNNNLITITGIRIYSFSVMIFQVTSLVTFLRLISIQTVSP